MFDTFSLKDELLDIISQGLDDLQEMAIDMNKELDVQKVMLEETDMQMDRTKEKFQAANSQLKDILDKSGGDAFFLRILLGQEYFRLIFFFAFFAIRGHDSLVSLHGVYDFLVGPGRVHGEHIWVMSQRWGSIFRRCLSCVLVVWFHAVGFGCLKIK